MATQHILPRANYKSLMGVVVNAGERLRTIRVRVPNQTYNSRLHKYFNDPKYVLVHDPRRSCDVGDVINVRSNWRVSKYVRHVVTDIVSPFGRTLQERPPVMTEEERVEERAARRRLKDERQAARGRQPAIQRLHQGETQAKAEALDETRALKRVSREGNDMRGIELQKILVGENDLDLIKRRIRDALIIGGQEQRQWALEESNLQILTLWLALQHAAEKHLYVGKDLAIRAGKSPNSAVIRESELMAAFLARRAKTYHHYFSRLAADKPGKNAMLRSLQGIQKRMTRAWRERVFETNEPDANRARQERRHVGKIGSDAALVESGDQAWLAVVREINKGAQREMDAERRYWIAQRAAERAVESAAVSAVVEQEAVNAVETDDAPVFTTAEEALGSLELGDKSHKS